MSISLLNVNGKSVTKSDVISYIKISGEYQKIRTTVVMNEVLRDYAQQSGIELGVEPLQVYSDIKRIETGLHSSKDVINYLERLGISPADWEESCEIELFREVIKSKYGSNIEFFDAWRLIQGLPEVRKHIEKAILEVSSQNGINPTTEELQVASDTFRRFMGLHSADDFNAVLEGLSMTSDDWDSHVHANIAIGKLGLNSFMDIIEREVRSALRNYPIISNLISDFVFNTIIHTRAQKAGITINHSEIQEFADNFRRTVGLHNANAFGIWLSATGFTINEFEHLIETELLKRKFAEIGMDLVDNTKIDRLILASSDFLRALNKVKMMTAVYSLSVNSGYSATDAEINAESEYLRRVKGLHSLADFQNYLQINAVTLDEWEEFCTKSAIIRKLYERETSNEKIISFLENNLGLSVFVKNSMFSSYVESVSDSIEITL